ncbi:YesL family protein [Thalassobacillus pellis]|uniref:YesL family protein n=1 Tax=Thalassobacillus pellis TaxID=748008 RepID=UPI00196219EF|nr:DUF624 domain-containing protein [Thalassobacillus pellis]MBM7551522.1 putative membrane protein YesL [Thalassobacillus pellis]
MMQQLTSTLSYIAQWITRIAILNVIWLLFSLPVITLLPSTYAMFQVVKVWNSEDVEVPIFRTFWDAFRTGFGRSYLIGLPIVICEFILFIDFLFLRAQEGEVALILTYGLFVLFLLFQIGAIFAVPVYQTSDFSWYKSFLGGLVFGLKNWYLTLIVLLGLLLLTGLLLLWTGLGILLAGGASAQLIYYVYFIGVRRFEAFEQEKVGQ